VADLATGAITANSVELTWTAPGDDGSSGTASTYDIRFSTSPITNDTDFNNATQATGEPAPQVAGSSESFTVTGLNPGTTYYFAIKTADEVPNWSALSNVPSATTSTAGWFDPVWLHRKAVNLDGTQFCETVSGFPVPITISGDTDLQTYARADGFDILFTLDDGTTQVPHEIEIFTKASGDLVAWDEFILQSMTSTQDLVPGGKVNCTETAAAVQISGPGFSYRMDKASGALTAGDLGEIQPNLWLHSL